MTDKKQIGADLVQPFQLESSHLRGRLVRLGPALDLILHQHAYHPVLGALLGEATVIAAALSAALKYNGVFTLQAKGDGPVRLLVADVTSDGGIRAYAQKAEDADLDAGPADMRILGKGYLAFTCSLIHAARGKSGEGDDRYQGIVELEGKTLAEAVQHYFRQSEQIPTGIVAAVHRDAKGRWQGGCLMLQRLPREGGIWAHKDVMRDTAHEDDWHRAMLLMGTCTPAELTDPALPPNDLLYRLFNEEGVRVFDPHPFRHQCRCSEKRVAGMLRSLPRTEVDDLAEDGVVTVTCEFCNKSYLFDEARREKIYGGEIEKK